MALILSLDSTTSVCSVALHQNGILLGSEFIDEPRAASSRLAVAVKTLFEINAVKITDLSGIAISKGPGSYTGLRIATSLAKGLCLALNIPLIAINSLQVLSYPVVSSISSDLYCPMIDARRMEVYCALLNPDLNLIGGIEAKVLTPESFLVELNHSKITFFGDGSNKFRKLTNHPNAVFVEDVQPDARNMGNLASKRFDGNEFEDVESFEPFYLKDFMIKKTENG